VKNQADTIGLVFHCAAVLQLALAEAGEIKYYIPGAKGEMIWK
jgi:hypothetical protein